MDEIKAYAAIAKLYVNGSDGELASMGITREEMRRLMFQFEPDDASDSSEWNRLAAALVKSYLAGKQ